MNSHTLELDSLAALQLAHDISYRKDLVFAGDGSVTWVRSEPYVSGKTYSLPIDLDHPVSELDRIASVLHYGAGLLRYEPNHGFRVHRGFPSPRGVYPTEIYLATSGVDGLGHGLYHYQATQHRVVKLDESNAWAMLQRTLACELESDSIALIVGSKFERLSVRYGDFAYALCTFEAGHALGSFGRVASELGYRISLHYGFDDALVREAINGVSEEIVSPLAIAILHNEGGLMRECRHVDTGGAETQDAPAIPNGRRITEVERAAARIGACRSNTVLVPSMPASRPRESLSREFRSTLRTRNSGSGGPLGELIPNPVPLSAEILQRALSASWQPTAHDLTELPMLQRYAVVIRFEDIEPGVYLVSENHTLNLKSKGDVRERLRAAYTYPPDQANLHALAGAIFYVIDYPSAIERWGARGLRIANLVCGLAAQQICLAAASAGVVGRAVRAFDDNNLEAVLGVEDLQESAAYGVLLGSNRHPALSFNLAL